MAKTTISRRQFVKATGAATIAASVAVPHVLTGATADLSNAPAVDKKRLVAALGDTIIPTAQGDPGYKTLEQYGITDEVLKGLGINQQDYNIFNAAAAEFFQGKTFLELNEEQRTEFLQMVVDSVPPGSFLGGAEAGPGVFAMAADDPGKPAAGGRLAEKVDASAMESLRKVFRFTRARVFKVFYQNFPEDHIPRDKQEFPILPPGDQRQILNPNTKTLVTGWDIANFPGPLGWEEEEQLRAQWKKIHWHED